MCMVAVAKLNKDMRIGFQITFTQLYKQMVLLAIKQCHLNCVKIWELYALK